MDRSRAETLVTQAFNFPFDQTKYSELISNIFKNSISITEITLIDDEFKEFIEKINYYCSYKDDFGKKIHAIEVIVKDIINFDKSRSIQRNFAIHYLKKNNCDSVIVSFYNKQSEDWRFSLVTREVRASLNKGKIKVNIITSETKKLSYLVGKNEPNFTAKNQILSLINNDKNNLDDIKNAFSVEKVTDDFFNDYKNLYSNLKSEIDKLKRNDKKISQDFEKNKIKSENFAKKTLGQIVFLFFLQKKGWLGVERNENKNFKKWGSGSKTFISDLFKKYEKKVIKAKNFYNDILEPIFYDALNNPEDFYEKLDCKMPFLNGGLFDPINGYNWYETDILIKDETIKNILKIFNQYNFTVTEDQPLDREVAVDPEMLGKVFEKLLNEKERKKGGAHYTPREVVHYMCKKSIFYFINRNLDKNINQHEFDLLFYIIENFDQKFIDEFKSTSLYQNLNAIDELLKEITICDPAIGSGAFPVSMMIQIVNLRSFIARVSNKEVDFYKLKRNFIENNLFGVDIDSSAVDIAKLRLWLSLIVDEKSFEKINPLPNLDYKIMQGNSLIEKIYDIDLTTQKQSSLLEAESEEISLKLFGLLDKYYNSSIRKTKFKVKEEIKNTFFELISSLIEFSGKKISNEKLKKINENVEDIFNEKKEKNFFLWNIFFHEVFKKKGGFDLILSNPPYIKEYTDKNAFSEIKDHEYYQGKMDIWYFMTCKSLDHLNENGVLCFIAQNNWFTNAGAKKLRNKITKDARILEINDFVNYMIFDSADQQTMIMILDKNTIEEKYNFKFSKIIPNNFSKKDLDDLFELKDSSKVEVNNIAFNRNKMQDQSFNFNSKEDDIILNKIEKLKNFYIKDTDITNGIHPHHSKVSKKHVEENKNKFNKGDGIFVLKNSEIRKISFSKSEKDILKPVYFSANLKKFYSKETTNEFILYTSNEFNNKNVIKKYPKIKSHLDNFKPIITSDFKPYGLHRKRNERFFQGEKIASLRKCIEPKFTYTDYECYLLADHYIIKCDRIDLKYLTLYLNSKIIKFWFKYKGKMQGTNFQIDAGPLLKVPIFYPKKIKKYLDLFEEIKKNYKNESQIILLEKKLNKLLYLEFGLKEEEIDYIEKNT